MKIGRRKSMLIACWIGVVGVGMTYYMNLYSLVAGRALFGISTGLFSCIGPKYVEETIPENLNNQFTIVYLSFTSVGSLIGYLSGEILPPNDDDEKLAQDQNWKIIVVWFPLAIYGLILLMFIFVVRNDSIRFLITQGK